MSFSSERLASAKQGCEASFVTYNILFASTFSSTLSSNCILKSGTLTSSNPVRLKQVSKIEIPGAIG
jgi:hypothetical protein